MKNNVRVRFAPSPTGPLHIGGVRTALFNYLFAKKNKGQFILRIEDTDQKRFVKGAEEYIIESLTWAGIHFDEGVHLGGTHTPYRQSDRFEIYQKYAKLLIENGYAYYAFDTPEELDNIRLNYQEEKKTFQYDANTRMGLRNSLSLDKQTINTLISDNTPYVVRLLVPQDEIITVHDLIRGDVQVNSSLIDDKVIFKSDGLPTYHLANVVDDYLMEITHVIRGEEWLPSAPLHVLLYKYLGFETKMPQFAHLPLILKPEGNGKLSKRDGDKHGFPVFPLQWTDPISNETASGYREAGYFPQAFTNMLAMLGWNAGTEQELFSMDELIEHFSLERVSKAGAKFSPDKTKWFNQQYLRQKETTELASSLINVAKKNNTDISLDTAITLCNLYKERVHFIHEIWEEAGFLFNSPIEIDEKIAQKKCNFETIELLNKLYEFLSSENTWHTAELNTHIHVWIAENNLAAGKIMLPLRLALVGALKGPDLFEILNLLGKEESLLRINKTIEKLKTIFN